MPSPSKKSKKSSPAESLGEQAREIIRRLKKMYPDAECELRHENPLQLLIATILSAQCTDKRVNMVTPELFGRYPDAKAFAASKSDELENMIRSTGFFRNKAQNIQKCCRALVEKHGGKVPGTMEELIVLGGVGRKTANVVLGNAFGIPGMVVDTHVMRLSNRLGLTKYKEPVKIERDLMEIVPKKDWTLLSHLLIFHGRRVCFARKPNCPECRLRDICPTGQVILKGMP